MKKLLATVLAVSLLMGCATPTTQPESQIIPETQPQEFTFTDALDREVTISNPQKVAIAMGSFVDVWMQAGGVPFAVTEDALDKELNLDLPADIISIGAINAVNIEKVIAEGVDFLIMSSKRKEHVELQETLDKLGIKCAYFEVNYFEDYLAMLDICTSITGKKDLYQTNGLDVQAKIDTIIKEKSVKENPPKILFIRAFSTAAKAQNSTSTTGKSLQNLGCINIADSEKEMTENLSMEQIIKEDPDFIFMVTMGSSTEKAMEIMKENFISNPAWQSLSAVKNDRYVVLAKELFHNKPNARWAESYEILSKTLNDEK